MPLQEETMTLAPAAGAGIGKILADRLLADPKFIDLMVSAVINGLRAVRSFWVKRDGVAELVTEEDSKIQLHAFALIMAHMEGEPIKRIIHQHLGSGGTLDPLAALQESPALREAARRMLDKAEWRTSPGERSKAHAARKAIEVTEIEFAD